ncbi:hypothetical protein C8Q74DRAFT_1372619 [Fomes fomentarius]|nr:hypothetical protein C8Q74DRAFT_1372619 [Fomes fomentarius]
MLEQFSPLFPNLRGLEWRESSGLDPHLSRLLGSLVSTSSLSAFFYRPASNSTADMSLLTSLRPDLPHLRVWDIRHMLCGTTAPLIPLRSLVSVHILDVDPSFFCHLATLAHLEDVAVSLARKSRGSRQRKPLPSSTVVPGFRSLKRFATLGGVSARDIVWMLSVIATTSTRLSTLDIAVRTSSQLQGLLPTLEKIGSMPVLQNLRTLKLRLHLDRENRARLQIPFSNIASPFYTMTSLEDVAFDITTRSIDLSEQDLTRMQEAWPNLKKLAAVYDMIDGSYERAEQPQEPTLASVIAFARNMDQLKVLDIDVANVSAADVDQICALAEECAVGHELQHLTFARPWWRVHFASGVDSRDVDRLACALRRIFPRMRGVSSELRRPGWWSKEEMRSGFYRLLVGLDQR